MLAHEGGAIGWSHRARRDGDHAGGQHLHRVADAFIVDGIKRAMSARMHMATVEEANRELTEKNRRLAQAVERLQEADRVKSNFLATVSHELRTPLTSVIGYSEMLLEGIAGELNDEQREYVRTVMEKGDQLLQLITGILDISRMEAGEMKIDKQPFDLDEVVSVALSTIAPHARRKKLRRWLHGAATALPLVLGDRDKIRQVLLNLLGNAVKFTPEGGKVEVRAALAPLHAGGRVGARGARSRCATRASACRPSIRSASSIRSSRSTTRSTREYGGTGLGLSIVKRLVEAHGGVVWVESRGGQGRRPSRSPFRSRPGPDRSSRGAHGPAFLVESVAGDLRAAARRRRSSPARRRRCSRCRACSARRWRTREDHGVAAAARRCCRIRGGSSSPSSSATSSSTSPTRRWRRR